jgi:hypothetical protein
MPETNAVAESIASVAPTIAWFCKPNKHLCRIQTFEQKIKNKKSKFRSFTAADQLLL